MESMNLDIFRAYGFPFGSSKIIEDLRRVKRTFPLLIEAIASNRYPSTIVKISERMGMYIPSVRRVGNGAYEFFIQNVRYYEEVLDQSDPSVLNILLTGNQTKFMMKFRDEQMLRFGESLNQNYTDRPEMIENFLRQNILPHGRFELEYNRLELYEGKAKTIVYIDHRERIHFSVKELLRRLHKSGGEVFTDVSLLQLRHKIVERFKQWSNKSINIEYKSSPLQVLLDHLETLLMNKPRVHMSAYLGRPTILE